MNKYYTSAEIGLDKICKLCPSSAVYLTNEPDKQDSYVETTVADIAINAFGNFVVLNNADFCDCSYTYIALTEPLKPFKDKLNEFIQDIGYDSLDDLCDLMLDEDNKVSEDFNTWLSNNGYIEKDNILNVNELKKLFNRDELVQLTRDLIDEVLV